MKFTQVLLDNFLFLSKISSKVDILKPSRKQKQIFPQRELPAHTLRATRLSYARPRA